MRRPRALVKGANPYDGAARLTAAVHLPSVNDSSWAPISFGRQAIDATS
jgi:hypothetical protein